MISKLAIDKMQKLCKISQICHKENCTSYTWVDIYEILYSKQEDDILIVHSLFPRYGIIDTNIYKIIAFFSLDLFSKGDIHLQGSPICDMDGKCVKYQLHKYVTGNITSKCIEELWKHIWKYHMAETES